MHPQSEGFTSHQHWDFDHTDPDQYPLLLHFPYFDLYRKQVVKQADLVLALHWRGDAFSDEEKARDFGYYEAITVRDSLLSACTQAVIAAEVGHLDLAYDYFGEAARVDLDDLGRNTRDGVHIASLAGAWLAAVAGFGGMRDHDGNLTFAPRLERLIFRILFRGPTTQGRVRQARGDLNAVRGAAALDHPPRRPRRDPSRCSPHQTHTRRPRARRAHTADRPQTGKTQELKRYSR